MGSGSGSRDINGAVVGNCQNPRPHILTSLLLELRCLAPDGDEGVLHGIFRKLMIAQHPPRDGVCKPAITIKQDTQSLRILFGYSLNQLDIRRRSG